MKTKKEFRYFSIFNHEKEQAYLQEQHRHGWKFWKVTGLGMYHFVECDPEEVVYQLDYNPEGSAHKEEYQKMFADCGWEYILDYAGYSYFRKEVSEDGMAEEIFCDEDSRLQMMERVLKGRMLPLLVLFFCCLLPQFINSLLIYHSYFLAAFLGGILALYVGVFAGCAKKYMDMKKKKK